MSQVEKSTAASSLHVSQEVISNIIINCISEVDGVSSISPLMKTPIQIIKRGENYGNIRIAMVDDVITIAIGIIVKSGSKAVVVAENVQNKIKSSVQSMLGLTVAKVDVTVTDVDFSE